MYVSPKAFLVKTVEIPLAPLLASYASPLCHSEYEGLWRILLSWFSVTVHEKCGSDVRSTSTAGCCRSNHRPAHVINSRIVMLFQRHT